MPAPDSSAPRWLPHVTVAAIARRADAYLLVEENTAQGLVLNQPAGHVEPHESLQQAVVRETLEETGWQFVPTYVSGVYQFVAANRETYFRFTFYGELTQHDPAAELDADIHRVVWMDKAALQQCPARHRSAVVLACIEDFEAGQRIALDALKMLEVPR